MVVVCLCSNTLKYVSLKSFLTSVLWDRDSNSGSGNDLCVEDTLHVFFLPLPSILIWPNILMYVKNG